MERFRDLLLAVWREVCRHMEIHESTGNIVEMLAEHLPLEVLLVRSLDISSHSLSTAAMAQPPPNILHATVRTPLTPAQQQRLVTWSADDEIRHGQQAKRSGPLAWLVPPEIEGEVLVGPLRVGNEFAGALVFVAPHLKTFKSKHLEMAQALLEPFSAALENDRRLHELATLREAAEADRRSLLTRIGRQEMSDEIVGADSGLRQVMQRVQLVAQSDVPVLILGETGTGKEVVSRAIHSRSVRATAPFIRVNCGAIPSELIDSQLFGHEKGSFTGAADARKGWFERADGGTLFLDEIGELPLAAQVRLLRVLQDGFVERVGGEQPIRVDVRIVAATHRDLAEMVKAGVFREDLWYRINVFPILLPRLRERVEDIPALARHFAHRAAHRFGLPYVEPSPSDLQVLLTYPWPGNIRELGAVIDRAAILGDGIRLEVDTALGVIHPQEDQSQIPPGQQRLNPSESEPLSMRARSGKVLTLDEAMREHIQHALLATRGKIEGSQGAAALLGINPHTLRARMRKLGITWSRFRS